MAEVAKGDTVRIHYTGRLDDGSVFDSSQGREPLEFKVGGGQVISGFDEAVAGMSPGQEKTVRIPAGEAYGDRREDLELSVGREQFPADIEPEVGQRLQVTQGQQAIPVTVTAVSDEVVTLDANHPLAGHDLTFEVELVEIV